MTEVAAPAGDAMDVDSTAKPRFEIKKWSAVAMWSWAICTDTCAICRNNLYEPSIDYQANPTGDPDHPGLSIAWGSCGHVFHLDCIQRWLKTRSCVPAVQQGVGVRQDREDPAQWRRSTRRRLMQLPTSRDAPLPAHP